MSAAEPTPVPPGLASDFYLWLWYVSQRDGGRFDLGATGERVELYVDDRLAFRAPGETKVSAVLTGDNPSETIEARAAVFGGKILQELRVRLRRDEQEFAVTLKGPELHLTRIKLPQILSESESEAILDRMARYDELVFIVGEIFEGFCAVRASDAWVGEVEPALRAWVQGAMRG
jgi:hypothetical protein